MRKAAPLGDGRLCVNLGCCSLNTPFFFSPVGTGEMAEGQRGMPVSPTLRRVLPPPYPSPIAMGEGTAAWADVP